VRTVIEKERNGVYYYLIAEEILITFYPNR
jgi:hypothetical protein